MLVPVIFSSGTLAKLLRMNSKAAWAIFPKCASASLPNTLLEATYASMKDPSKFTPYSMALATVTAESSPGSSSGLSDSDLPI
jgi:hypothetical protein